MRRIVRILTAAVLGLILSWSYASAQSAPDRAAWRADLDQLRDELSARYPNLEWAVQRGMDLPGLYSRAQRRIDSATDDWGERRAIERFVSAFADGHIEVSWPASKVESGPTAPAMPEALCDRLGWFDVGASGNIADRLPGYRPLGAQTSARAGIVTIAGHRVGVLRLPIFEAKGFPEICAQIAAQRKLAADSPCDDACRQGFEQAAYDTFLSQLSSRVRDLTRAKPDVILVDIAGNGGGDGSSVALAHLLTARPLTRPRIGGVRTAAWVAELKTRQAAAREAMASGDPQLRKQFAKYDAQLSSAIDEASRPCNLRPLWDGRRAGCSNLFLQPLFAGLRPDPPGPGERIEPPAPIWRGPLIVLLDADSASSSELFAAMLQDAHAARIMGAPSAGAGCGHMTGAPPIHLAHSGANIRIPDCFRLRADGTNEMGGIQPDVLIGFRPMDSDKQRVQRLQAALPATLVKIPGR